jgi:hypothetical protein
VTLSSLPEMSVDELFATNHSLVINAFPEVSALIKACSCVGASKVLSANLCIALFPEPSPITTLF